MQNGSLIIFGGIVLLIVVFGYRRYLAHQDQQDAVATWAALHGYERQEPPVFGSTRLLRTCDPLTGPWYAIAVGMFDGSLGFETSTKDGDDDGEKTDVSVVLSMLGAGFPQFAVYARQYGIPASVAHGRSQVEFESADFDERYRVVAPADATTPLHRLFTPELLVWWVDNADGLTVEYENGALVVACRAADGSYDLDTLVGLAGEIAARVVQAGDALVQA